MMGLARSYLRQARARLIDAKEARRARNYPYAVRLSQECVELSLKGALRAVGIDYPKVHDVSDVLEAVEGRFPDWFRAELSFMAESSRILFKKMEPSLYGGEEALLGPDEVIERDEAEDAARRAQRTHRLCARLVKSLSGASSSSATSTCFSDRACQAAMAYARR